MAISSITMIPLVMIIQIIRTPGTFTEVCILRTITIHQSMILCRSMLYHESLIDQPHESDSKINANVIFKWHLLALRIESDHVLIPLEKIYLFMAQLVCTCEADTV